MDEQAGIITRTFLFNFDLLKPHFYIVKLGFTEVAIIFLILLESIGKAVLTSTHNICFEQKYEKYEFLSENFQFLEMKFSIYLHRRIFVMESSWSVHTIINVGNAVPQFIFEPAQDKTYNKTCVTRKDSDQPVHPPSTAKILVYPSPDSLEAVEDTCISVDSDQTHTCHTSHCETKSHRIWLFSNPFPHKNFKSHRIFRLSKRIFYEELIINYTTLYF